MVKKRVSIALLVFLVICFSSFGVFAQSQDFTYVISNSGEWKDVYSTMHYANLKGVGSDFLVSPRHGPLLMTGLNRNEDYRVINSRDDQLVLNYDNTLESNDFRSADEVTLRNPNLDLILDLPEVTNFIVVNDLYGYNAVAVAPYASLTDSWVFFADRGNVDEIDAILDSREVDNLIIYGFVDRDVKDTLEPYNPEIIDNGDRFKDNIEITQRYLEINPTEQVLLTNGDFLERELMGGASPILFTGRENVPAQIRNYIQSSDIEVGVLVGADLVGAATNIRRSTGISVIVKFARGARNPTGAIAAVEGLDLYYLPIPLMDLSIHSANYNRASSQLEVTYRSDSNIPVFFSGTITPIEDGEELSVIGDVEPVFIAPDDYKTVSYSGVDFTGSELLLDIFTLFGDTPTSLDNILEETVSVDVVNIIDNCEIEVLEVVYSKPKEAFVIYVENIGDVTCHVDIELSEVIIDGDEQTIGSEGSIEVAPGKKGRIYIDQIMTDEDLEENPFVNVIAYYGEREDSLVKIFQGRFELQISSISFATIGLIVLAIIVVAAIFFLLFFLWKRRKEDDDFYY